MHIEPHNGSIRSDTSQCLYDTNRRPDEWLSQPSAPLPERFAGGWDWLLEPQDPQQQVLQRQQRKEDAVAQIRGASHYGRHERVHPVVVRCCHYRDEYETRISQPNEAVDRFPEPRLFRLSLFQGPSEDARVVNHGAADDKGVAKMHAGHGGERVDKVAAHPYRGGLVVAYRVEESIFRRKQARRHARVKGKGQKGEEIGKGEGAADGGEGWVRGRNIVIPRYEAVDIVR